MQGLIRVLSTACILSAALVVAADRATAQALLRQVTIAAAENRAIAAGPNESVDVLFSDGTSLLLAPGAQVVVEQYQAPPGADAPALSLRIVGGLVRVSGGALNEASPIRIVTAQGRLDLQAGSAMVEAEGGTTRAHLLNGGSLDVTAGGTTRRLYRPGFELAAGADGVTRPRRMSDAEIAADLVAVNPGLATGQPPVIVGRESRAALPPGAGLTDDVDEASAGVAITSPDQAEDFFVVQGPDVQGTADVRSEFAGLDLATSFDPGVGVDVAALSEGQSSSLDGSFTVSIQDVVGLNFSESDPVDDDIRRSLGPTSNSIVGSADLETIFSLESTNTNARYSQMYEEKGGLKYAFAFSDFEGYVISLISGDGLVPGFDDIGEPAIVRDPRGEVYGKYTITSSRNGEFSGLVTDREAFGDKFPATGLTYGNIIVDGVSGEDFDADESIIRASLRRQDNFIFIQLSPPESSGNPQISSATRLVFATGDLDGLASRPDGRLPASSVDRFYITAGLTDEVSGDATTLTLPDLDDPGRKKNARSFLRTATWTDLGASLKDLTDHGLYVVNPSAPVIDLAKAQASPDGQEVEGAPGKSARSVVLHADFGLAEVDGRQVSSISTTVGEVAFRLYKEETGDLSVDALVSARTVASSSTPATDDDPNPASTLITSDFVSTAAGGGNPNLTGDGRVGFFVMENAGLVFDDIAGPEPTELGGGTESPLGKPQSAQRYAALRLATATRPDDNDSFASRRTGAPGGAQGYAMGLVEFEQPDVADEIGVASFASAIAGPNLAFGAVDLDNNILQASLAHGGKVLRFGGSGASAYVDDRTYGLIGTTSGTQLAMISAEPVAQQLEGKYTTSEGRAVPIPIARTPDGGTGGPAYKHVQWGFFFGDTPAVEGKRRHVHLGTYAAGSPISARDLDRARGTATYAGHAIGNVQDGSSVHTAVGTFQERFDFDRRTGATTLDFDGRNYRGDSRLLRAGKDGPRIYRSTVRDGDVAGSLDGRFVGGMASVRRNGGKAVRQPNGIVGAFELSTGPKTPAATARPERSAPSGGHDAFPDAAMTPALSSGAWSLPSGLDDRVVHDERTRHGPRPAMSTLPSRPQRALPY